MNSQLAQKGVGSVFDGKNSSLEKGLQELIEEQVALHPNAIALRYNGSLLSYAALNERANQCAHYLRDLGVGPEVIVGVLMHRSVEMVVALLGILKAGGAYLPLDPTYPRERIAFIVQDTGISLVLSRSESAALIEGFEVTTLFLDQEQELLSGVPSSNPLSVTQPDHLAYVIFTSGSTGKPKGCMNEHRAICNRLVWMRDHYGISAEDRILQKTPYTFDVSVWEFFLPLLSGACLVLAKPEGHKDTHYLIDLIRNERITICHFVPSMLRFFLRDPGVTGCTSLRNVFVSGEALSLSLMRTFQQTLTAKLHNLYGPTEAAVDVTYWECAERDDQKVPIGCAISNLRIHILNTELKEVPRGEIGELYIGGIGVGRGYLNRTELTRERFVKDPFAAYPNARLYRTGDKARVLADGNVEFLGRLDFQVKIRGFRVELGEIEATLRKHEAVEDCAVLVRDEDSDDPKLVAYIVSKDRSVSTKEARDYVKSRLPEYMAPNRIVCLKAFPTSAHGKLDRSLLPWPASDEVADISVTKSAVSSEVLSKIRSFFEDTLKIKTLRDGDDLFDAGATSFTIVQVAQKIESEWSVGVPVELFFDNPTVGGVADFIAQALHRNSAKATNSSETVAKTEGIADAIIKLRQVQFRDDAYSKVSVEPEFSGKSINLKSLGQFLTILKRRECKSGPKYFYSSAGGLRPIQTYLFVKNGGVEGLESGFYYYHPNEHRLHLVRSAAQIDSSIFCGYDEPSFSKASFALFLIAEQKAIEPIYRDVSPILSILEAGYISQSLIEHQSEFGLAVRPATGVDFDRIRECFELGTSHQFIHCLLAGAASDLEAREAISLGKFLKTSRLDIHAHWARSQGANSISHFIRSSGKDDRFPTLEESERHHREEFHLRRIGADSKSVALETWDADQGYYFLRSAKRIYRDQPVSFNRFSRFLGLLAVKGTRYLYRSFAGDHPIKIFVYVKSGAVENVPEGLYRYDSLAQTLRRTKQTLSEDLKSCYTPFNRKHFQQAKFCLFLIGQTGALNSVYGKEGLYHSLLEAGFIGQLLLDRQAEFEMGICPIGGMRFEKIRDDFQLDSGDEFLHSFIGGEVDPDCTIPWEPLERTEINKDASGEKKASPTGAPNAVAIVGISGRYPGAEDLHAFARNLRSGASSFTELSFDQVSGYRTGSKPGKASVHRHYGGFLSDVDCFDSLLFHISPVEARTLDPQERLFMEVVWECLENGGYTGEELNRVAAKVGVFVGAMWDDYQHHHSDVWNGTNPDQIVSAHHSSIANRVSFFFDFKGPSLSVNTSCSSALTALHYACKSLFLGECNAAIVGGVNIMSHPYHLGVLAGIDLLSEDSVCRPFGAGANGWVAGEGVGAVLLKPLDNALRDGDTIHGVIRGTTISHSGKTGRYGAPKTESQTLSIQEVLDQSGVSVDSISYVEAAAPGAGIADASEAAAIRDVLGTKGPHARTIHVGSIKSNIGHLESASAISQLTKVLLQMKHRQIFPTLGFQPINPLIQWEDSGLEISNKLIPWHVPGQQPRRALINAFGATGSGGHIIVEEFCAIAASDSDKETLILLSAATLKQLEALAIRIVIFLGQQDSSAASISDIGFTLRVGRLAMKERVALIVHSKRELAERLELYAKGTDKIPNFFHGQAIDGASDICRISEVDLRTAAERWVRGACSFLAEERTSAFRRVPLPPYPFAKVRHWIGSVPLSSEKEISAPSPKGRANVEAYLKGLLSAVTEIPVQLIENSAMFDECGLTSVMIQRLNQRLRLDFGEVSASLFFEYRTIVELSDYFLKNHRDRLDTLLPEKIATSQIQFDVFEKKTEKKERLNPGSTGVDPRDGREIAIIGVAGKYPKSSDISAFWENLRNGIDCITEIPPGRWNDTQRAMDGRVPSKWGGFIDGVDEFDPFFFKISPKEAEEMDPQERLFLQTAWHLFEDAGYVPSALSPEVRDKMGV
ncbi:MAG: polyketide synthase, partial [Verrucomicrobiales bacterium]|nr:polyketide synthase [Verrucomicrobiales bacterium]